MAPPPSTDSVVPDSVSLHPANPSLIFYTSSEGQGKIIHQIEEKKRQPYPQRTPIGGPFCLAMYVYLVSVFA